MKNKFNNIFLIFIFFAIILAPTVYTKFGLRTPFLINENRELQKVPSVKWGNLADYPKDFEQFYSDNYGFRQELILANKKILDDVLDVDSISGKVLVGEEDWLYSTEYGALKDYQGILKYNPELLKKLVDLLVGEYREAKKNNVQYLFVVIPDKHTVYPEYLPDAVRENKVGDETLLDQLIGEVRKVESDFPFLDLREVLWKAKQDNVIYWQTDTHWNEVGAFYGYRAIIEALGGWSLSLKNFEQGERKTDYGNLAEMIHKKVEYTDYYLEYKVDKGFESVKGDGDKRIFMEKWSLPLDKETGRHSYFEFRNPKFEGNLLMFRDSYTDNMLKFLPHHFNQSIFIWLYPCKIRFDLAKKQGIDVVIRQVAETRVGLQVLRCE